MIDKTAVGPVMRWGEVPRKAYGKNAMKAEYRPYCGFKLGREENGKGGEGMDENDGRHEAPPQ
jgi:hypothetical protein